MGTANDGIGVAIPVLCLNNKQKATLTLTHVFTEKTQMT